MQDVRRWLLHLAALLLLAGKKVVPAVLTRLVTPPISLGFPGLAASFGVAV